MSPPQALQDASDIREGFEAFIDASRRLEESYAELQSRAAAIDLQLAETNTELEKTLLEREMVFASLPVGLLSLDARMAVHWCNPEGRRLQELAEKAGRDLTETVEGDCEIGGVSIRTRRVGMPDGGTLVLVEDRSQLVHLEREVDRLDRMAGLSELALGIAHEIKNPLNGVMGFAALYERTDDRERQKQYVAKIGQGLTQVDSIVKALLAFARPADKSSQPAPVRQVIAEAASAAGLPSNRITLTFADDCDENLEAEASVLVRVLGNLFRNSAEAQGGDVSVTVHVESSEDRLVLTVRDDGPGIPQEHAAKIFQPLFSTKDRGHGLGLSLACRVLSFLEGSLELLNPGEAGACFRVTTPTFFGWSGQEVRSVG